MTWPAVAVVIAAIGGQAFWIGRALDAVTGRLDRLEARLAGVEAGVAVNVAAFEGRERS